MSYYDILGNKKKHYNTFSVISDSYSALEGFVEPSENAIFYPNESVTSVEEMWWYLFAKSYDSVLQVNNSFSGSRIANDISWYAGVENSFIGRANNIGKPELIFILGGTNDLWNSIPIGDYVYSDWTEEQLQQFRPSVAYLIDYLKKHNVGARIVYLINTVILTKTTEYYTSIKTICEYYDIDTIDLNIETVGNHPTKHGMNQIRNDIMKLLECKPKIVEEITADWTFPMEVSWSPEYNKYTLSSALKTGSLYRIDIEVSAIGGEDSYVVMQTNGSIIANLVNFNDDGMKGQTGSFSKTVEGSSWANGVTSIGISVQGITRTATVESIKIYEVSYDN